MSPLVALSLSFLARLSADTEHTCVPLGFHVCPPLSFRATSPLWRRGFLVKCFAFPEALHPGSLVLFMLLYFKDRSGLMGN